MAMKVSMFYVPRPGRAPRSKAAWPGHGPDLCRHPLRIAEDIGAMPDPFAEGLVLVGTVDRVSRELEKLLERVPARGRARVRVRAT
jgi:hypothetical protein